MNVDSCHDGKETVLGIVSDLHLVKMIIVKDTVVDSFGGSPVFVDLVPFIGSVSKRTSISRLIAIIDIDDSTIV